MLPEGALALRGPGAGSGIGQPRGITTVLERELLPYFPERIRAALRTIPGEQLEGLEEIRLRVGRPLMIGLRGADMPLRDALPVDEEEIWRTVQLILKGSMYALEHELRNGFITLEGGHRVGLAGTAVVESGKVRTLKNISGICVRVCRQIRGVATPVMRFVLGGKRGVYNTLLLSPPQCGKTTMLRDIVRQLSEGVPELGFPGCKVVLVDERSEVAGCHKGIPQNDVGLRTDVLDGCPKAEGILMAIRSMSPDVVATDEIGRSEDVVALEEALNAGVSVITTAHGSSAEDFTRRPALKALHGAALIQRVILLGRSMGVGTVEAVYDGEFMTLSDRPAKWPPGGD